MAGRKKTCSTALGRMSGSANIELSVPRGACKQADFIFPKKLKYLMKHRDGVLGLLCDASVHPTPSRSWNE